QIRMLAAKGFRHVAAPACVLALPHGGNLSPRASGSGGGSARPPRPDERIPDQELTRAFAGFAGQVSPRADSPQPEGAFKLSLRSRASMPSKIPRSDSGGCPERIESDP